MTSHKVSWRKPGESTLKIQLIRSATLRVEYAGHRFVIDPYLAAKFSRPSFTGRSPNPLIDLPCPPEQVIANAEMVIVSHLHSDHFDPAAQELLPKDMSILCQPVDAEQIMGKGFRDVTPIEDKLVWQGITITRVEGQHGSGEVLNDMGRASGFVFQAQHEPTIYWAGDTIWTSVVGETILRLKPQIIITHSSGAVWGDHVLIVMDAEQTIKVCHAAPASKVIAVHLDSLDHGTVSREDLRRYADEHGVGSDRLLIPLDGETLTF
jgi:L-ascorbate metabolism protein UlaG (beta-lactamase superfamily)